MRSTMYKQGSDETRENDYYYHLVSSQRLCIPKSVNPGQVDQRDTRARSTRTPRCNITTISALR